MKNRDEVLALTQTYGGSYGLNHSLRLLEIISGIGAGMVYDEEVLWLAALLHDWGAYAPWAQPGVDHVQRSVEVVTTFLAEEGYPPDFSRQVLECVANHHNGNPDKCLEAKLLSDADAIDYLGIMGVLRDFAKCKREMRSAFQSAQRRAEKYASQVCLESARPLVEARIQESLALLKTFEAESFGLF